MAVRAQAEPLWHPRIQASRVAATLGRVPIGFRVEDRMDSLNAVAPLLRLNAVGRA